MHATSSFNVEASINQALVTALNAISPPAWLPQPAIVMDWPEIADSMPCFSIVHMPATFSDVYQGRNDAAGNSTTHAAGMMEVSAWVSRDQKYGSQDVWMPRLRFMASMIETVYTALAIIAIKDYTVSLTAPTSTGFRVAMRNMTFVQTAADPNPAVERRRATITYMWDRRA